LGALRIRKGGGAGGQKGLKSVIEQLRTEEFARLRVGVGGGHPGADVGEHVLSKFRGARLKIARELTSTAADALESMLREGIDAAMNKYNSVS
jgi:PTH1 family peptidyl-tRNA hydrolase